MILDAALTGLVTKIISSIPAATASSTMYATSVYRQVATSLLVLLLLAGSTRVPRPATGKTALRILIYSPKPSFYWFTLS